MPNLQWSHMEIQFGGTEEPEALLQMLIQNFICFICLLQSISTYFMKWLSIAALTSKLPGFEK